jgi:hypothetical protein
MATGGWFGTGLGLGDSRYLPAGHTDLILAAIGEELGAAGLTIVAALYAILAWRGIRIARLARNDYGFFLATALTLFLIVPALIMASGTLGVTPLTGVVTPFLSYGGSAMAANFGALGMLAAIHADRNPSADFEPFRIPIYWLEGALGVFALALLAVMVDIQIVHADDYVAKPHLGVQADGGRRFEYNPRVLDLVRLMPRGTIYDRQGIPLATDDPKAIASGRPGVRQARYLAGRLVSGFCRAVLPVGRESVSPARRRADARQLERTQHLVCRARCRGSAARLRRSLGDRAHDRRGRQANADAPA